VTILGRCTHFYDVRMGGLGCNCRGLIVLCARWDGWSIIWHRWQRDSDGRIRSRTDDVILSTRYLTEQKRQSVLISARNCTVKSIFCNGEANSSLQICILASVRRESDLFQYQSLQDLASCHERPRKHTDYHLLKWSIFQTRCGQRSSA
jgi:hypothetical protein